MKLIYTDVDGFLKIVTAASKEKIEEILGPLTDEEYTEHVITRSIPEGVSYKFITEEDIPLSREFRNAWCDVTTETSIDIDCTKAKDIQLQKLRSVRNEQLNATDKDYMKAFETNNTTELERLKELRQSLRDVTEPLKALDTSDEFNNTELLEQIKTLGTME